MKIKAGTSLCDERSNYYIVKCVYPFLLNFLTNAIFSFFNLFSGSFFFSFFFFPPSLFRSSW